MKKLLVSVAFIGLSAFYVFSRAPVTAAIAPASFIVKPILTPPKTGYKDGVFTGSVADAFYGLVQVRATIKNGLVIGVAFLQYPSDRENSIFINNQAMPLLTQEAIQVQNANVDTISGATETSVAFRESLAAALASAKY